MLDAEKHYWVGDDEVEKLLRHGEGWLNSHPHKEVIVKRYLKYRHYLAKEALARLADEDSPDPDAEEATHLQEELAIESPLKLWEQRMGSVISALKASGGHRILDLGCGEGKLLRALMDEKEFTDILGMDVSHRSLEIAADRLHLDRMPPKQRERIKLIHGSLMYKDQRLSGYDAACVVEVIEHLDPPRLAAFERVLFELARPQKAIITTPNAEYNVRFETLPAGQFRHKDHRFEWTRAQFQAWAGTIAERFGYSATFLPVGPEDPDRRRTHPDGSILPVKITIPELSLVTLIGPSGAASHRSPVNISRPRKFSRLISAAALFPTTKTTSPPPTTPLKSCTSSHAKDWRRPS